MEHFTILMRESYIKLKSKLNTIYINTINIQIEAKNMGQEVIKEKHFSDKELKKLTTVGLS